MSRPSWMVSRVCERCGGEFLARKYDVANGHGRFCSKTCRYKVLTAPGPTSPRWKGGRSQATGGYIMAANGRAGGQLEHIQIVEAALGHPLPKGAQVHHVNGVKSDNRNRNLVACQDAKYHKFLHSLQRIRALGGRPFLDRLCSTCREMKPVEEFSPSEHRCKPCNAARVAAAQARSAA